MPDLQEEITAFDPNLSYFDVVDGVTVVIDDTTGRSYTWPDLTAWRKEVSAEQTPKPLAEPATKTLQQMSLFA